MLSPPVPCRSFFRAVSARAMVLSLGSDIEQRCDNRTMGNVCAVQVKRKRTENAGLDDPRRQRLEHRKEALAHLDTSRARRVSGKIDRAERLAVAIDDWN